MKNLKKLLVLGLVTIMTTMGGAITTYAAEPAPEKTNAPTKEEMSKEFSKYGVDKATQDKLFEKLDKGQAWDSLVLSDDNAKKEKISASESKYTYPDGSIKIVEAEKETPIMGNIGTYISGGSSSWISKDTYRRGYSDNRVIAGYTVQVIYKIQYGGRKQWVTDGYISNAWGGSFSASVSTSTYSRYGSCRVSGRSDRINVLFTSEIRGSASGLIATSNG